MYQPVWPLIAKHINLDDNPEVSEVDENGMPLPGYSPYTQVASYPFPNVHNLCHSLYQDLLFLLYCSPGEWPGQPEMGIGLREYLFSNSTDPMWGELETRIRNQVAEYLPWLEIDAILLSFTDEDIDNNYCKLTIKYAIPKLTCRDHLEISTVPGGYGPHHTERRWDFRWLTGD